MLLIDSIRQLLLEVSDEFEPPLTKKVNLDDYSKKIVQRATIFTLYENQVLIAFVAAYCNDPKMKESFITMLVVSKSNRGKGIGDTLVTALISHLQRLGFEKLKLEVYQNNSKAINFYLKLGFKIIKDLNNSYLMNLDI